MLRYPVHPVYTVATRHLPPLHATSAYARKFQKVLISFVALRKYLQSILASVHGERGEGGWRGEGSVLGALEESRLCRTMWQVLRSVTARLFRSPGSDRVELINELQMMLCASALSMRKSQTIGRVLSEGGGAKGVTREV